MQPRLGAAWFLLGVDLQELNRPADAVEPLRRALEIEPRNLPARLELGDALFQSGNFSNASAEFRLLSNADPANTKAWLGLGLSYNSLAGQAFEHLRKLGESAYLEILIAQSRADQHQYRSAYQRFRQALKLDPHQSDAHRAIASIYRKTGHADWAEIEEKSIQPDSPECVNPALRCLFAEKRYEELLSAAHGTRTPESYYWQARAYKELALITQEKLADLPPSAEIHQLLAITYDMQELYQDAIHEWRQALTFQPGNRNFQKKLAWSLSGSGEWQSSAQIAAELLKTDPDSADLHFLLGDDLLKSQLPEQAVPHFEKVLSIEPKNLRARASLGSAYLLLRRFREAIFNLEGALSTDQDGALVYQLAQAYRSAGEGSKAASLLAKYKDARKSREDGKASLNAENEITPPN